MAKLKNKSRKRLGNNKSKRSRKSRKLRRQTRRRKYKMRGGMNMMGLLAALFAVVKKDTNFESKDIVYGPNEQFAAVKENVPFVQTEINAGNTEIPTNFNLNLYIDEMNEKKYGTDDDGFKEMLDNNIDFGNYKIEGDSDYSKEQYYRDNNIPTSSL